MLDFRVEGVPRGVIRCYGARTSGRSPWGEARGIWLEYRHTSENRTRTESAALLARRYSLLAIKTSAVGFAQTCCDGRDRLGAAAEPPETLRAPNCGIPSNAQRPHKSVPPAGAAARGTDRLLRAQKAPPDAAEA